MPTPLPSPLLIAVDAGPLLDLAAETPAALACFAHIRDNEKDSTVWVLPSALDELGIAAALDGLSGDLARKTLKSLVDVWKFRPDDRLASHEHGIVEVNARSLRQKGILPDEAVSASLIVAEAAMGKCQWLITSRASILDARDLIKVEMESWSCTDGLVIFSPSALVDPWAEPAKASHDTIFN